MKTGYIVNVDPRDVHISTMFEEQGDSHIYKMTKQYDIPSIVDNFMLLYDTVVPIDVSTRFDDDLQYSQDNNVIYECDGDWDEQHKFVDHIFFKSYSQYREYGDPMTTTPYYPLWLAEELYNQFLNNLSIEPESIGQKFGRLVLKSKLKDQANLFIQNKRMYVEKFLKHIETIDNMYDIVAQKGLNNNISITDREWGPQPKLAAVGRNGEVYTIECRARVQLTLFILNNIESIPMRVIAEHSSYEG